MTEYTMRKTTVGFVDGLSETQDTWGPLTITANSGDANLADFFAVQYQEYTHFEWDGPDEEFPHEKVHFVGEYGDDAVALSFVLDPGVVLPSLSKLYENAKGLPLNTDGWIERLAFGPGYVMYFGVEDGAGIIRTVPIYVDKCDSWGDDDFANIRCVSWRKFLDENAVDRFSERGDDEEEVDSDFDYDDEPSLWAWEFTLAGEFNVTLKFQGESPTIEV